MKRKVFIFGILIIISILTIVLVVFGQNNGKSQNQKTPLVDRFEKVIKAKEPKFDGGRSGVSKKPKWEYSQLGWKLHEDYVGANVTDYYKLEDAITTMKNYVDGLDYRPAPAIATKLTKLGDEAYIELDSNSAKIKLRKGNVVIKVSATNQIIAKRFAKYFVREIEKRDRGEP